MKSAYLTGISHAPSSSPVLLEKFPQSERARMVFYALYDLDAKGTTDPLAWFQEQAAMRPEVLNTISTNVLMRRDPARTMEWLQSLPAAQQAPLIGSAVMLWCNLDPPAALNWLTTQPVESLPADLSKIGAAAVVDPQRFHVWKESLPPGEIRDQAGFAMAQEFARQGRLAEAQQYFPRDGNTDWFLNSTRGLANTLAASDISAAKTWVSQLPPGPVQAMAVKGVIDQWAGKAPAEAAQWAQTLPPGEARDTSMRARGGKRLAGADQRSRHLGARGRRRVSDLDQQRTGPGQGLVERVARDRQ